MQLGINFGSTFYRQNYPYQVKKGSSGITCVQTVINDWFRAKKFTLKCEITTPTGKTVLPWYGIGRYTGELGFRKKAMFMFPVDFATLRIKGLTDADFICDTETLWKFVFTLTAEGKDPQVRHRVLYVA